MVLWDACICSDQPVGFLHKVHGGPGVLGCQLCLPVTSGWYRCRASRSPSRAVAWAQTQTPL